MASSGQVIDYEPAPPAQHEKEVVNVAVQLVVYFFAAVSILLTLYYCVRAARSATLSEEQKKQQKILWELKELSKKKAQKSLSYAFEECPICLEKLQKKRCVCTLPCGHSYHLKCIENWVQQSCKDGIGSCPVCKTSLEPLAEGYDDVHCPDWSKYHIFHFV